MLFATEIAPSAPASLGCRSASRTVARMRWTFGRGKLSVLRRLAMYSRPNVTVSVELGSTAVASLTRPGKPVERDVGAHVPLDRVRKRLEVPQHAQRVELVGQSAQEAPLPRHPRVVVRVLARPHVRERLMAVEVVRAAGIDVDPRLRLAPRRLASPSRAAALSRRSSRRRARRRGRRTRAGSRARSSRCARRAAATRPA